MDGDNLRALEAAGVPIVSTACTCRLDTTFLFASITFIRNHITSHHITSHHITSHHITSHHILSFEITSHHITSHHITSHHNTSHHTALYPTTPQYISPHHYHHTLPISSPLPTHAYIRISPDTTL
jgi:hypothetical protein